MKLIRYLWPILNLLAILVIMASPVLAFLYSATYTVTNNSTTTSYTMLPVMVSVNNTYLAANGFIESTALDTRVETVGGSVKPHLVADNKTLTAVPAPVSSQTNLRFTTGNSALTSMDMITGYGGYVTMTDAAALELGANFQIDYKGYLLRTVAGGLSSKEASYKLRNTGGADLVSEIYGTVNITGTFAGVGLFDLNGIQIRVGQRINAFPVGVITGVEFYLTDAGSAPVGIATVTARKVSDDSIIGTFGTIDVTTIGAGAWYAFGTDVINDTAQDIRIQVEYVGTGANYIQLGNSAAITGQGTSYIAAYTDIATDSSIIVYYSTPVSTVTGVIPSNDEFDVRVTYDGAVHELFIDDLVTPVDTDAWVGAVADSGYDWVVMSNTTPYMDYYMHTVGGNLTVWYQPVTIVNTTVLPDRQGAAQDGIITWGTNPATVNVVLGSLVSSGQSDITDPTTTTSDVLGEAAVSDWFTEPDVSGTLATNPFRPFVTILSDTTTLTERQAWIWLGITLVLLVTVGVGMKVKGHHFITGVACGATIGLLVQQTVFPFYSLTFIVVAIVAGVMAERKRQM